MKKRKKRRSKTKGGDKLPFDDEMGKNQKAVKVLQRLFDAGYGTEKEIVNMTMDEMLALPAHTGKAAGWYAAPVGHAQRGLSHCHPDAGEVSGQAGVLCKGAGPSGRRGYGSDPGRLLRHHPRPHCRPAGGAGLFGINCQAKIKKTTIVPVLIKKTRDCHFRHYRN